MQNEELGRQLEYARAQELGSYDKVMSLLKDHINENLLVQKRFASNVSGQNSLDERKQAILKESYDKLQAKYEMFRKVRLGREEDYKRQLSQKIQLEESFFDYDVETINFLNECNWNLGESCDRGLAETLLSCFPSGTFLVRSTKTKPNSFALSVVANSKVRHCLIDKIGDEYCFHPPGPHRQNYPTMCGLVMDYRHKSLLIHNPELDTNLIYPVLSQLKKTSKGTGSRAQ